VATQRAIQTPMDQVSGAGAQANTPTAAVAAASSVAAAAAASSVAAAAAAARSGESEVYAAAAAVEVEADAHRGGAQRCARRLLDARSRAVERVPVERVAREVERPWGPGGRDAFKPRPVRPGSQSSLILNRSMLFKCEPMQPVEGVE
jgi:hypothetical protein